MKANFPNYDDLYNKCRHHLDLYGLKYFKPSEFEHFELMSPILLCLLDAARAEYGRPINITSSFRTPAENKSIGGALDSAHLTGEAVDIYCSDCSLRFELLRVLFKVGFRRIGVYSHHIHVDVKQFPDYADSPALVWYGKYSS